MCLTNEFALSVVQNVGSARRYCFVTIGPKCVDQIAHWRHLEKLAQIQSGQGIHRLLVPLNFRLKTQD